MSNLKNKLFGFLKKPQSSPVPLQFMDANCTPEVLGSGAVGTVYRVTKNGCTAAVKVIPCTAPSREEQAVREYRLMQQVNGCKHTVSVLDYAVESNAQGKRVSILQEYHRPFEEFYKTAFLTEKDIVGLGIDICSALIACRDAGFLHLDVQPKNLFVAVDNSYLLGDFGSALPISLLPNVRSHVGTLLYMAPEAYHEFRYSEASELYALGMLLYTLCNNGHPPFYSTMDKNAAVIHRLNGAVLPPLHIRSSRLADCICRACAYHPKDRFSCLDELLQELRQIADAFAVPTAAAPSPSFRPAAPMFSADSFASTCAPAPSFAEPMPRFPTPSAPAARPAPMFSADSFASTCAPAPSFAESMPRFPVPSAPAARPAPMFSADSFASTCALPPIFDNNPLTTTCALAPTPTAAPPQLRKVQFSAISPKTALKGEYTLIQLYMYEALFRQVVEDALAAEDVPMQEKKTSFFSVATGTRVRVVLTSSDVEVLDGELEQLWEGDYLIFDFAIEVPTDYTKRQILLKASIYFDDVPATRLLMTLHTQSLREQKIELRRQDVLNAFVSYAREDQSRVGALVQGMRKARPDMDIFFDITGLRSGEDWEARLQQQLERCDTLFLCWSRAASHSPWVDREWRFVLANKGLDAIEPVPIEPPNICPPPPELNKKYFNDTLLYLTGNFNP